MENININIHPELVYYPVINFNAQSGVLDISGESYMEETYKFYEPVFAWLNEFSQLKSDVVLNVRLTYFNTSSSRFILDILEFLKNMKKSGRSVIINWFYKKSDQDMLSEIIEFEDESGISINKIEIE